MCTHSSSGVRTQWSVLWLSPAVLSSLFPQTRHSAVVCLWVPIMPWNGNALWTPRQGRRGQGTNSGSWRTTGASTPQSSSDAARTRADFCLQSTPAAAPADQPHYFDSTRVVCHSRSGLMRTGTPSSHHDHCVGNPCVLALNGTYNAALRCAPERNLLLSEATVLTRLFAW